MPGVAACPGHPCSELSSFVALPAPVLCPELNPSLSPRRGAGSIAHHARSGVWLPRGQQAHRALPASSLPCVPYFCTPQSSSELLCCKIPSWLLGLVEIGRWIQTVPWVADRQADRQHECESFISVRNWAKNYSLSQRSLSSMFQTEVCKAERKHYTDSNG